MHIEWSCWYYVIVNWTWSNIIQVNFAREHFEKEVAVGKVFAQDEMIDIIGVTKGHGYKGENSFFYWKPNFPLQLMNLDPTLIFCAVKPRAFNWIKETKI